MSEYEELATDHRPAVAVKEGTGGLFADTGQWVISQLIGLIHFTGIAAAVVWQGLRPLTWRRTVRKEFLKQCHLVGWRALPFIMITGCIVGLGIVYQAIYWLGMFGQAAFTGPILVLILVREIAPLFVALIVIGRSGSVTMIELGSMRLDGQLRMLDALGVDPFLYLVVPRAAAAAVCMFSLTIAFIAVAFGSGFIAGNVLGAIDFTLYEFIIRILAEMGYSEFATIPLKTVLIGFVVALIACTTGFSAAGSRTALLVALPHGIIKSVLATLLISSALTLLL